MRPLKLTITAFGPYATQQIIDFRLLKGRNLFVITGDTGAGKTTILDGISYALYGKASGRDRDGENLRSHFAAEDILTSVELEFELKGERYWVQRIPKQRKKRTRGEGYTDQNTEAQFKNLDGESKLVTGFKEVSEKIVQLMGLTYEQFKQIIMIPQGEFRELLNADSKMRQEILQKIFGTEGFRRIQDLFDGQAKSLHHEINHLESQRNEWIRSLDGRGYEPLAQVLAIDDFNVSLVMNEAKIAIDIDDAKSEKMGMTIDEYERKVVVKQEEIFQGKGNNLKFSARDEAQQKKIKLEACQALFDEKKCKLQQGRRALGIAGVDEYRNHRADYVVKKKTELASIGQQMEKAEVAKEIAEHHYQLEYGKEEERTELLSKQARLQGLVSKATDWESRQTLAVKLEEKLAIAQRERDHGKKQLEKARTEVEECQVSLEQGRSAATAYSLKVVEQEKINGIYEKLKTLHGECKGLLSLEKTILVLEQETTKQLARYKETQTDYEKAQELFFEGQAGILAAKLRSEELCPVCGSSNHPRLAVMLENSPTESDLKKLMEQNKQTRELYDEVKGRYERGKADHHAQQQILLRLQKELGEEISDPLSEFDVAGLLTYIDGKLPRYELDCEQLQGEMKKNALKKNNEQELALLLIEKTEAASQFALALDKVELQYMELFARMQSAKDAMESLTAELPREVRSVARLAKKIEEIKIQYSMMKEALEKAEGENQKCQVTYAATLAERRGAEKNLHEGETELVIAKENFMKALLAAGFNDEIEYKEAKLGEDEAANLEQEINGYQEELRSVTDYYFQIEREVEHLTPVDIVVLEAELLGLQMEKKQLILGRTDLIARQTHNQATFKKICTVMEKLEVKEEEYLLVGHLARIAKGDNEQKISFERYVLAAFFNDIIEAANGRLKKMTGGRYQMSRITQKGKGSGQSGLEIEVFDYYTGQSRHVKTLSGGESFKASLALALGLAEVVQSYAGGISLETMFVDEGFGTLDPESLDTAIACLIELQHSGRLVGIISHVPELKDGIDARLEIEACKDGSQARFCIM